MAPSASAQSQPGLVAMSFVDSRHGWVAGSAGNAPAMYVTSDGGATWSPETVAGAYTGADTANRSCGAVFFLDMTHGWTGCSLTVYPAAGGQQVTGETYATADGGATWSRVAALNLTAIRFLTTTTGMAMTNGAGPYRTTDGGRSWELETVSGGKNTVGGAWTSMTFGDATHGWATAGYQTIATLDGGATWRAQQLPGTAAEALSIAATSATDAVAVGGNPYGGAAIVSTTNGGATWLNHSDPAWLARIYQDALGRPADAGGLAAWLQLIATGATGNVVVIDITRSAEYRGLQVDAVYRQVLRRPSDAGGRQGFVNAVAAGATYEQVITRILASAEYSQDHGSTNAGWLTGVYSDILGRPIDGGALSYWNGQLARRSRVSVALSIVTSTEGLQRRLSGMYGQYLHRTAAPEELGFWSYWMQNGWRDEQIVVTMLAGEGYPNSVVAS